ncbi:MAG: menaquinone biosynthesis protein [Anaerolineae bacterium]
MTLTIGVIDYLNVQPVYYRLQERLAGRDVRFVYGVPTTLNRMLIDGEIDLAPISAIETARHADQLAVIPNLGIATLGAVKTVLLFSWMPDPAELDGCTVALTDHSATSVELLKALCRQRYGIAPRWRVTPQNLEEMLSRASGALLIGDEALIEGSLHRSIARRGVPHVFDLGDEWLKWTGLPFVFALWTVRRDRLHELAASGIVPALHAAKADGLAHIEAIAQGYAPRLNLPPGLLTKYLRDLRYDLTGWDLAGLERFLGLALPDMTPDALLAWQEQEQTLAPLVTAALAPAG